tara:strand:- start:290 stop:481 length:192 start_codon:yes stop_codon:yes gene_type:complete
MPALDENLVGVYPENLISEVKNAQGALLSTAFGLGNLVGTILGGVMGAVIPAKACLKFDRTYP